MGVETISVHDSPNALEVPIEEKALSPPPPSAVPDGGIRAWLQVLGCWLVFFNVWGFTFSFGPFQSYYELDLLKDTSPSNISWVGTIAAYLLILTGVISGPAFDLGYYKMMLFGGAAMSSFGIFMLSLSHKYYQIFMTQGICLGLGCGVLYIPGLALVSRSFSRRRAMAMGIVTSGAPVGGIIYTITFDQAIDSLGFAWTVRVMGFIMMGSYIIAFPLLLWGTANTGDISSGTVRKLFDIAALKDLAFWLYTWSNFFLFCGYMVPFFYMASYAQVELGLSRSLALYSIVIAQGVSVVGRLLAATAALRFGVMIPWLTCGTLSGVLCMAWAGVHSTSSFLAFAALYALEWACYDGRGMFPALFMDNTGEEKALQDLHLDSQSVPKAYFAASQLRHLLGLWLLRQAAPDPHRVPITELTDCFDRIQGAQVSALRDTEPSLQLGATLDELHATVVVSAPFRDGQGAYLMALNQSDRPVTG
ncbi:hypothetical protein HRR78_002459 [Exophiala dermatitidis]|nr:hypothetical protein HRR78_002459 [Exophiala dermatitidis]